MTMLSSKAFLGRGLPRLEYAPVPPRIDRPESIRPAGPLTLLHLRPAEAKAVPAVKIGAAVKTGQKLSLWKAWGLGYRDSEWVRRDPDLASLHGDPEFEKLYPEKNEEKPSSAG